MAGLSRSRRTPRPFHVTGWLRSGTRSSFAVHDADRLTHRWAGTAVDDGAFGDLGVATVPDVDAPEFRVKHLAAEDENLARIHDVDGPAVLRSPRLPSLH